MTHPIEAIDRLVTAGFDAWNVSLKIVETMVASQTVIGARMAMLGAALDHPRRLPFGEFSRLVPEKAAAFGKANAARLKYFAAAAVPRRRLTIRSCSAGGKPR